MSTATAPTTTLAPVIQNTQSAVPLERSETFGLNWTSYSTKALHSIVCDSIKALTVLSRKGQSELRQRLLPALQEVRNRLARGEQVDGHETVTEYLASIGLSEGVIRKWEFRVREKELRELGLIDAQPAPIAKEKRVHRHGGHDFEELRALSIEALRIGFRHLWKTKKNKHSELSSAKTWAVAELSR